MFELFVFLRGLALGLVLALILTTTILFRRSYAARLLILFGCGICGYLLAPLLHERTAWFHLAVLFSNIVPVAFLLFAQAVFTDHLRPAKASLIAGVLYFCASYSAFCLHGMDGLSGATSEFLWLFSRVAVVLLMAYSMMIIVRPWREDLVEPRRLLRLLVTVVVCGYILGVAFVESYMGDNDVPLWLETVHSAGVIIATLLFGSGLLVLGPQQFSATSTTPIDTPHDVSGADRQELETIVAAMEIRQLYRDMELTIRSLAEQLAIPEHRLRGHINQQLGYRNFNDFLNRYRVAETSAKLSSAEHARVPVLTIAMDAGYRSMTTFNKAFKAIEGKTPREYRQQHQANS